MVRKALGLVALLAIFALAASAGLLEQSAELGPTTTTTTVERAHVDEHGESGPLPGDPRPPAHVLKPSEGLSAREQRALKARRVYIDAPIVLGPVEIRSAGHRKRYRLLVIHTAVPASVARTALRAARYAHNDRSDYDVEIRGKGKTTPLGHGPIAAAAAAAVRRAVQITPAKGRTAISLPAVTTVQCKRAKRAHRCTVETFEFLADRNSSAMNAHRRSYRVTVATAAGKPRVTKITAAP